MEYERKKKQILASVEYNNLLGFTLVENKLERNFKSLVEALLIAQAEGEQTKDDLNVFVKNNKHQFVQVYDKIAQLEKKLQEVQKPDHRNEEKSSMNHLVDVEELGNFDRKTEVCLSAPKLNINLVQSPPNTHQHIPSAKEVPSGPVGPSNKELQNLYSELSEKMNKLMNQRVDPYDLDKKLGQMRDNINLLRAQIKAINDREAKSNKRTSMVTLERVVEVPAVTNPTVQPSQASQKSMHDVQAMNALANLQEELEKQINGLHIEVNSLQLAIEELKESNNDLKRKEVKNHSQLDELAKNHKKLDEKVNTNNDSFETQIKQIKMQLLNLQTKPAEVDQNTRKSKHVIEAKQNVSPNANNQINDRISKLQAAIQGLVTDAEFKRFKTEMKDKISGLEEQDQNIRKELKEQVQMMTEILDGHQEQMKNVQKDIEELKLKLGDMSSNCQRKNNIGVSRYDELKKNLQNLREDLEFYKSMNQNTNETKVVIQGSADSNNEKQNKNQISNLGEEELKKYLNRKLHDQRQYLLGLIRDLEKKSGGKSNSEQDLVTVWDKLGEINLFLNKKANEDDVRKSINFLEKKLAALFQRISSADQCNQDARIAKTNWFCLSCDKGLQNYQGKVGQHVVWDSMPIKQGYTKYFAKEKDDTKKSLPTLKR